VRVDLDAATELARNASDRVLSRIADHGQPLLPPAPPSFTDGINKIAAKHLARAWTIDVET
jgi:hypothetical protein